MRSEFRWYVPRRLRKWWLLKRKRGGAYQSMYVFSPLAWSISQRSGRRNAMDGYTPIWSEVLEGRVIDEKGGYSYYGPRNYPRQFSK